MRAGVEPSAARTPISRVRWATDCDRTPKRPMAAMSRANTEKVMTIEA
jgi:hypothetical protein